MEDVDLTKYIGVTYRMAKRAIAQAVQHLDVRPTQCDLLVFVARYPNQTQKQIAAGSFVDPSLLARDLRALEQKGLLQRTPDPDDRRANRVHLTESGAAAAAEISQISVQWWQTFAAAHPELDVSAYAQLTQAIGSALMEAEFDD